MTIDAKSAPRVTLSDVKSVVASVKETVLAHLRYVATTEAVGFLKKFPDETSLHFIVRTVWNDEGGYDIYASAHTEPDYKEFMVDLPTDLIAFCVNQPKNKEHYTDIFKVTKEGDTYKVEVFI